MNVLVTGGRGTLGRPTVRTLEAAGHTVTITTRRPSTETSGSTEVRFDLASGDGAQEAVAGQQVIVHIASDTDRLGRADVAGTRALLAAAEAADVEHVVYISIVGCDEIPFRYYKIKTAVERDIAASPLPHTTLRTTQYHEFAALLARRLSKTYVTFIPKNVRFQSLDSEVAASRLATLAAAEPQGRVDDLGGPEAHLLSDLVEQYLTGVGKPRPVVAVPLFGAAYHGFAAGKNLTPEHADDSGLTWDGWLQQHAADG